MATVTIDRAEYDRLIEAAEELDELRAYDRAMQRIESGEDELIPAAFADRLFAGENPVRVYRGLRGLTQMRLAEVSGVNRVQIADIEAGRRSGSIATLAKLANALDTSLDDLAV
ncbi:helix-turn-helix transcriptional regulator [Altererythrobacter sp. Root672]|uniref:helix-turn-helix transcriptional regulator n=1 Tax=Altererythrobacter sp. Root672 TaxID=1736584 RepID=UPI000701917A|nr:helix-turn-helix transcriptional regulator [Altererythrobacter sp. Root672]KRA83123.1 XRE family transcriptional regulator [Altererythrobacter sp. Root672]